MNMFGPIFTPGQIIDAAVDNPQQAVAEIAINAAVDAVDQAINPSPEQRAAEERAREEQGRKEAEARAQKEQAERKAADEQQQLAIAQREAQRIQDAVRNENEPMPMQSRADVLARIGPAGVADGIGFDHRSVQITAEENAIIQRILAQENRPDTQLSMEIGGLDGWAPEIPPSILERTGVIRLSRQSDEDLSPELIRDTRDKDLEDGSKRIPVVLEYSDGAKVRLQMDFRPEAAEEGDDATVVAKPGSTSERKIREAA